MPLIDLQQDGTLELNPHDGQFRAFQSQARIIAVISGAQGGKTSLGPVWLWQEMQERGAGDYLVVTPTFPLLYSSALPKFREFFEEVMQLGRYVESPTKRFVLSEDGERRLWGHKQTSKTTVRFGYAADPNSLEALTLKGLWADECGQPEFKQASWDNLYTRRLAVHRGRALLTTTPYSVEGWLRDLCDQGERSESDIEVIRFDSTANPAFSPEMFEEARRTLPGWKFDLFFRGIFSRPAGLIFDSFIDAPAPEGHLIKRRDIPITWRRFIGLDFGGVNTAAVLYAAEQDKEGAETGRYILYRTYHPQEQRTAAEHVKAIREGETNIVQAVGGSKSEGQWREEFGAAGLYVLDPPVQTGAGESIIEVGINRVYAAFKRNQILIFDDLKAYLSQLRSYSREADPSGNVTEKIANKTAAHYMDATRYIWSYLAHQKPEVEVVRRGRWHTW